MSKLYWIIVACVAIALFVYAGEAHALSTFQTVQGGTGTSSPSGILYGDNSATTHLNTVTIGSNLTFSAGTLSASGGAGGSGNTTWEIGGNGFAGFLAPTTTQKLWLGQASSTIFSATGPAYFGATATSSFSTAGALTLITPLLVGSGGSGAATLTGLLSGNGASAFTATANGTAGFVLAMSGGVPTWVATSTLATITGTLGVANGGTGVSTWTVGRIPYGNGTANISFVATTSETCSAPLSCTAHDVLTGGGAISLGTVGVANGGTGQTTFTSSQLLYGNGTNALSSTATSTLTATGLLSLTNAPAIVGASGAVLTLPVAKGNVVVGNDSGVAQATSTVFVSSTGLVGIASTTPHAQLSVHVPGTSNTQNALELSYATGGALDNATSTISTIASSTTAFIKVGTTTPAVVSATTTIYMQTLQFQGLDSAGAQRCIFVNAAGALTTQAGACN